MKFKNLKIVGLVLLTASSVYAQSSDTIANELPMNNGQYIAGLSANKMGYVPMVGLNASDDTVVKGNANIVSQIGGTTVDTLSATGRTVTQDYINATASKGIVLGETSRAANVTTVTTLAVKFYDAISAAAGDLAAYVGFGVSSSGPTVDFFKTRATSGAATTIVNSGDTLGQLKFFGANGTTYDPAAYILATSDATPGASADMPGALDFQLSPDGSATPASVLKLKNSGQIQVSKAQDINFNLSGGTIAIQEATGANACSGSVTAAAATPVVTSTTCATTGSRIFLTKAATSTVNGSCYVSALSNGVSFSITCLATDTGAYNWFIVHEAV